MSDAFLPDVGDRLFGRALPIDPVSLHARMNSAAWRRVLSGEPGGAREESVRSLRRKRLASVVIADRVKVASGTAEYGLTPDGVAIVPVLGVLTAREDWYTALCGWTTYEGLSAIIESAVREPRVKAVLLDVESPGGEAAGMIDVADKIIAARQEKPIWAVANSYAFSAAYAIAGSAARLIVPRLGQVGSIGAVCIHVDQSGYDRAMGLRYTAIYSGARKVDGWSHAPLSDEAERAMQASIDHCRDEFAALVGRQGRMSGAEALSTEAAVYHDGEAVAAKLADQVGTFETALTELSRVAAGGQSSTSFAAVAAKGDDAMAERNPVDPQHDPKAAGAPAGAAAESESTQENSGDDAPAAPDEFPQEPDDGDDEHKEETRSRKAARAALRARDHAIGNLQAIADLCRSQGLISAEVHGFFKANAGLDSVRASIAATKARESDRLQVDPTRASAAEALSTWDKVLARIPGLKN